MNELRQSFQDIAQREEPREVASGVYRATVWNLEITTPEGTQTRLISDGETLSIGTSSSADLVVYDPTVALLHARMGVTAGTFWVEDTGDTSGVFAGGLRISRARVESGGYFVLGGTVVSCTPFREPAYAMVTAPPLEGVIGHSWAMRRLAQQVRRLASLRASVLIQGETGTGKELIAQALHQEGERKRDVYLPLNVSALPGELAEAELFGHERGAFTGAAVARSGAFEAARGGTLFLDEVAELAPHVQAKLLRTLENGEVRPLGSSRVKHVDVRVVAATWMPLELRVQQGYFREDLYHRLAVFTIHLPPLRERRGDIAQLVTHFLLHHASEVGLHKLHPCGLSRLVAHTWPGNVRELRNVLLRAAVQAGDGPITAEHVNGSITPPGKTLQSLMPPKRTRKAEVRALLEAHQGNVSGTARTLGVARSTVRAWVR